MSLSYSVPILRVPLFTFIVNSSFLVFLNVLWPLILWFIYFLLSQDPLTYLSVVLSHLRMFYTLWHIICLANIQSIVITTISLFRSSIPSIIQKCRTVIAIDYTTYICSQTSAEHSLGNISYFAAWLPGSFDSKPLSSNPSFIPLSPSRSLCLDLK